MNRNLLYLSTLFLFLGACASTGSESSGTTAARADTRQAAPAGEAEGDNPDKVLCRRIRPTGSRMAEKVCRTVSQWEEEAERSQEEIRRSQSGSSVSTAEGG